MNPEEKIQELIQKSEVTTDTQTDQRILKDAMEHLEQIKSQKTPVSRPYIWRIIMKSNMTKFVAAAVIIIAVTAGLYFFNATGKSSIAWADVIKPIFTAKTAKIDIIVGDEQTGAVITDIVKGSRINRKVQGMENVKTVLDLKTSQAITFDDKNKTVVFIDLKNLPQIPNYLEHLRNVINKLQDIPEFEVKKLGEKKIDGVDAVGFHVEGAGLSLTIWADAQTAYPVRIEQQENNMNIICKNFQFDIEPDDSLFSTEVPPGYKEQKMTLDLTGSTEEDFIEGLKAFAEISEDKMFLPDVSVEYIAKNAAQLSKIIENSGLSIDEQTGIGLKFNKMVLFIRFFNNKNEGQWHYAGKGVKLGDANAPIFWYQPKNSQTWRVIYGDLSVADIAPEDLPK